QLNRNINRSSNSPQTPSPAVKRQLPVDPRQQRMDPRLAKRLNTETNSPSRQTDNTSSNSNGSGDHLSPLTPTPKPTPSRPTPSTPIPNKPYHEMSDIEVSSLVSAVRQTT